MKNKTIHIRLAVFCLGFLLFTTHVKAVTYFLKSGGDPSVLNNWGTNTAGTTGNPTVFNHSGDVFYLNTNNISVTFNGTWTLGSNVTVYVGQKTGSASGKSVTIQSAAVVTGGLWNTQSGTTLYIQCADFSGITTFNVNSGTVVYNGGTAQNILSASYNNLTVSGGTTGTLLGNASISGICTLSSSSDVLVLSGSELDLNGSFSGSGTLTGDSSGAALVIGVSNALFPLNFTNAAGALLTNLTIGASAAATCTVSLNNDLIVSGSGMGSIFDMTGGGSPAIGGSLNLNGHSLTLGLDNVATLSNSSSNVISGSKTSKLVFNNSSASSGSIANGLYMDQGTAGTSNALSTFILKSSGSSISLNNALNICDSICPTIGTINTGGNLTLVADQTTVGHTGRLGVVSGSISGNLTSQVYHSPPTNNTDWRLMGVAGISNATFSAWNSVFPMSCPTCPTSTLKGVAFSSISTYNEAAGTYPDITYGSTIAPGTGYWVYLGSGGPGAASSPFLIGVSGTAQTGPVSVSLTNSGAGAYQGDNLVANPYASPISFPKLLANNSNINNCWYTYSPSYGDNAAYVAGIMTPAYSYGSEGIDATIPAGMGFFVVANAAGSLNFIESLKTSGSNEELLRESNAAKTQSQLTYFRMQVSANGMMNEAVVRFDPNATTGFDGNYDLLDQAPGTPGWIQISSSSLGLAYAVNALPDLTKNYSIPVTITTGTTNTYQFLATDLQNIPTGACIKLHDKYTNTDYDLRQSPFNLTINDTETVSRFVLNVTVSPLVISTNAKQASCNNLNDGLITAVGTNAGPWNFTWKNAGGTVIKTSLSKSVPDSLTGLNSGVYSVDVTTVGSCDIATQSFTLTAPAAPVAAFNAPAQVNIGSNVNLTNNSTGATNYIWNFGNGDISSLQIPSYAYNMPGTYTITMDAINANCNDTTKTTQSIKVEATTGIKQVSGSGDITLSTDASGNYIQFNYTNQTQVNITVYNVLGQVLLNNASLHVVNDKIYLNVTNDKNQVLYVTITNVTTNQQVTKKFVND